MSTTVHVMGLAEQRQAALQLANSRRIERARIKRSLHDHRTYKESTAALATVLEEKRDDPTIGNARVFELLMSCARLHKHRTRAILKHVQITDGKRVCELTDRQFQALVSNLRGEE